ncbi:uncharacterized protein LOC101458532 isoform X2 [Ceratitis capitata]|uniref:uncharacterized protein LOC101458532 isoform X2 n=1 Tax=Ceratitis capitata TaxID=7213 RepID=UPI000A10B674|nr:uncharacterized protein LOC101458532 isoform X2 [Ceratitis capitata]
MANSGGRSQIYSIYALCNYMNTLTTSWELAYIMSVEEGLIAKLVAKNKGRFWIGYFPDVLPYPYRNVRFVKDPEEEDEDYRQELERALEIVQEEEEEEEEENEAVEEEEQRNEAVEEQEERDEAVEEQEQRNEAVEEQEQRNEAVEEQEQRNEAVEEQEERNEDAEDENEKEAEKEAEKEEDEEKLEENVKEEEPHELGLFLNMPNKSLNPIFLSLAKHSMRLNSIVADNWAEMLNVFSISEDFVSQFGANDFWDFCVIVGRYVETLKFNSVFRVHKEDLERYNENPQKYLRNKIRYINVLFHRHLVHFPVARTVQVEGSFLNDLTIDALARCCPLLNELKLLDPYNGEITGDNLKMLYNLEVLDLRVCPNLDAKKVEEACKVLQLRELHIVECRKLCNAPTIRHIIAHQHSTLTHLSLTAIPDAGAIMLILKITKLKKLKFYWLNDFLEFEKIFYTQLATVRPTALHRICCENQPPFMINQSHLRWGAGKYTKMREMAAIEGPPWLWMKCHKETQLLWSACTSLVSIVCLYCRVLSKKQLLILPRVCKSLKEIRFVGCRKQSDEYLLKSWQKLPYSNCSLNIEGELDWPAVLDLKEETELKLGNLYRSIECEFIP